MPNDLRLNLPDLSNSGHIIRKHSASNIFEIIGSGLYTRCLGRSCVPMQSHDIEVIQGAIFMEKVLDLG